MDTFSFDIKMTVFRSMVRQSMDFYTFYQKVCFVVCAETRLAFFLFFDETMCKFLVLLP